MNLTGPDSELPVLLTDIFDGDALIDIIQPGTGYMEPGDYFTVEFIAEVNINEVPEWSCWSYSTRRVHMLWV